MKEVTTAIIMKENRVLIAERAPGENLAGKWEFPGGKIEPGLWWVSLIHGVLRSG